MATKKQMCVTIATCVVLAVLGVTLLQVHNKCTPDKSYSEKKIEYYDSDGYHGNTPHSWEDRRSVVRGYRIRDKTLAKSLLIAGILQSLDPALIQEIQSEGFLLVQSESDLRQVEEVLLRTRGDSERVLSVGGATW